MAYVGKHNAIELLRTHKMPYWRLYENNSKRTSGNYICQANFEETGLDLACSLEDFRKSLDALSTGTYNLVAYTSKDKSKGGIDTMIEVEGGRASIAAIGSTGAPTFFMDGIGQVTADNFEEAIDKKFKKMQAEVDAANAQAALKAENDRLKKEVNEFDGGYNKAVLGIGSLAYGIMSQTPTGKEFLGLATKAMFNMNKAAGEQPALTAATNAVGATDNIDDRLSTAVEALAKDNPDWLAQLEKLATLKQKDPSTFEMAVGSLDSL